MTWSGGANSKGVLFQFDPSTSTYKNKLDFNGTNGTEPYGSLMKASNGKLYGMTQFGGGNNKGVLFQYDPADSIYSKQFDFGGSANGNYPKGSLIQASDGKIYGMTTGGGTNGYGVIFQYDPFKAIYNKKFDFDSTTNGINPSGTLLQSLDGKLYGMTWMGGLNGYGVIFQYDLSTATYTKKFDFSAINGGNSEGSLIQASDGKLYGLATLGGANSSGVLFQYDPITSTYTKKLDFGGTTNGSYPYGSLIQATDGKIYGMTSRGGLKDSGVIFQYDPITSAYTKKFDLYGTNGSYPFGSLMQASNGKLYGMTNYGGAFGYGVIFQYDITTSTFAKKIDFAGVTNGRYPYGSGSLIQASDGKLYGTTSGGGVNDMGVIFEYDPTLSTIIKKIDFNGTNGTVPNFNLIEITLYSINNAALAFPICAGGSLSVPFTITHSFDTGNVFTAQLSDSSGSFIAPVNIGSINSIASGTINATIPSNTTSSAKYRIRVLGSNPIFIGSDNGSDITVKPSPIKPIITALSKSKLQSTSATSYQWYQNGNLMSGATSQQLILTTNGNYSVKIDTSNGCTNTSDQFAALAVGIAEVFKSNEIQIYPNPNKGVFTIKFNDLIGEKQIEVYDLQGKRLANYSTAENEFEIQSLFSKGIYFMTIKASSGNFISKFVVE